MTTLDQLRKALAAAEAKSARLCEARASLPAGASRARVTSANARWASAAEERDRIRRQIEEREVTT